MKIKDIMTRDVVSVSPATSVSEVANIIFANRFHGVPVVENNKVVGIITEDDFFLKSFDDMYLPAYMRFVEEHKTVKNLPEDVKEKIERLLSAKARDLMTEKVTTVSPEMDVSELMKIIKDTKFTTFPVVEHENSLAGIVSLSDILGTVRQGSREMQRSYTKEYKEREIEGIAKELDSAWKEKLVIMSKKKVRTWQGMSAVFIFAALGLGLLYFAGLGAKSSCELENKSVYPLECRKFTYSEWSDCDGGAQSRTIMSSLPERCEGGSPELVRSCQ